MLWDRKRSRRRIIGSKTNARRIGKRGRDSVLRQVIEREEETERLKKSKDIAPEDEKSDSDEESPAK